MRHGAAALIHLQRSCSPTPPERALPPPKTRRGGEKDVYKADGLNRREASECLALKRTPLSLIPGIAARAHVPA